MKQYICLLLLPGMLCPLVLGKSLKDFTQCNFSKLCPTSQGNDVLEFDLLQCILNDQFSGLNTECKSIAFDYARNYVGSKNLRRLFSMSCQEDLKALECKSEERLIFCILNQKEKLTENFCANLVVRLERLIHAHFSLVSDYIQVCKNASQRLCSFNQIDPLQVFLRERDLLDCLQKNIDSISNSTCQRKILQISEVLGGSVRLDQQLPSSCGQDRINFCRHLPPSSNTSVVLKCLENFINSRDFTSECRNEILKKEKLVSKDVKVSKGLMRACRDDIRTNHCRRLISDDKTVRLAQMLLCLQSAVRNGTKISSDCRREMVRHKKLLLEDYTLSPEIMKKCSLDVITFCNGLKKNGETIHCLFEHSRPRRIADKIVSAACQRSLEELIKTVGATENWKVDPVIRKSCGAAVRNLCDNVVGDDTKVMSCLMDNINSNAESMTSNCTKAVLQIQYFVSRNYKLDAQLFDACHSDAVSFCHAKRAWNDNFDSTDPERGPLVLPCLFKYAYGIKSDSSEERVQLKPSCEKQVRRVMRQRAIRADLIPEVEEMCLEDLSALCTEKVGPGQEILCLQDNYSRLQLKCRYVVGNFTEAEASDINLNPVVKTYCKPVINSFCKDEMRRLKNESSDVMSCLIKHKNDEEMKLHYKCRAAVEHFQLISLNDYHFTVAFKNACRPYVLHYCQRAHTKAQVVECLSEVTQNDTLKDERYKLSRECRYQLRAQLLQQREFIDLDPKLKSACETDIRAYCDPNKNHNAEILECLLDNTKRLEIPCRSLVFRIQQQDFRDSSTDYTLLHSCKEMIKSYCKGNVSQALVCLKRFKNDPLFDSNCRSVVLRRMIEQSVDYRLNPVLQQSCNPDIRKFCFSVLRNHTGDTDFEGKVLKCLSIKFRERKLRKECEVQLVSILKESAMNYKLNPLLRNLCSNEIKYFCGNEVDLEKVDNSGQVEECLKVHFWKGDITARPCRLEVAGLIEEAKADIHVDPLLQRACALDVTKYCVDVPPGAGRILQCLLNVMDSKKNLLQPICKSKLSQRIDMFKYADKAENQEISNISELAYHLNQTSAGRYVGIILLSIVGVIFILGLYCGRVSRRYTTLKNK